MRGCGVALEDAGVRPCFPSAPWWWWHLPAVIYLPRPGWDLLASRARGGGGGICLPRPGWHRPEGFCKSTSNRKKGKWTQGGLVLFLWKASFFQSNFCGGLFRKTWKKRKIPAKIRPTSYLVPRTFWWVRACASRLVCVALQMKLERSGRPVRCHAEGYSTIPRNRNRHF